MGESRLNSEHALLLDTCALLWFVDSPNKLSAAVRRKIEDDTSAICVSAISLSEIAVLVSKRRIQLSEHWKTWFRHVILRTQWPVLSISWEIVEEAHSLPEDLHNDPADRILVATARIHRLTLVTPDKKILAYPHVDTLW